MRYLWCVFILMAAVISGSAQTLTLSSGSAVQGGSISLNLTLDTANTAPAGLQWVISNPGNLASLSVAPGSAATSAGKTVSCNSGTTITCLATGANTSTISSGVVAVVNATLSGSSTGTVTLPVSNVLGVTPDGLAVAVGSSAGTIAVSSTSLSPTLPPTTLTGPSVLQLQCAFSDIFSGVSTTCNVLLSGAAPATGSVVTVVSDNSQLSVPAAVTVAPGATYASFTATAGNVTSHQVANITAALNGTVITSISLSPANSGATGSIGGISTAAFSPILVNCGGGPYTDIWGNNWSGDYDFIGGNSGQTNSLVLGTAASPLYQTSRWGSFQYQFPVPNGNYIVYLKFAELYFTAAGGRRFNVSINGTPVLTNFDIVAQAGSPLVAIDQAFPVSVANGQISIQFSPGAADQPTVNAIQILAN